MMTPKERLRYYLRIFLVSTLPAFLLFSIWLFPWNDLNSWIQGKVSLYTQNQVYLDFAQLDFALFPHPAIELKKIQIESAFTNEPLKADTLSISPSITGLLTFKPGVSVSADGFLGGDLDLTTRGGDKTSKSVTRQLIDLEGSSLSLKKISALVLPSVELSGNMDVNLNADVDPSMAEPPTGELSLKSKKFQLVNGSIPTAIGAIQLPALQMNLVDIEGSLAKNKLKITRGELGKKEDELYVQVEGSVDLKFQQMGGQILAVPGGFDLVLKIQARNSMLSKFQFFSLLDSYKSRSDGSNNYYNLRIATSRIGMPPTIEKIQ